MPQPTGMPYPSRQGPVCLRTIHSADADEFAEHLSAWDQHYEQLARGRFAGRLDEIWIDDLQLFRERSNLDLFESGEPWRGSRTFAVPLALDGGAVCSGRPLAPDMLFTLGPGDELELRAPGGLDIVGIACDAAALARFTREVEGIDSEVELRGRRLLPVAGTSLLRLRRFLGEVFMLLEAAPGQLAAPEAARNLRHSLLEAVIAALRDADGEPPASFTAAVRRATVQRARDYALSRPDEPLTVAELCTALRISRRSLQTCFQDILGMSPHQYLRTLRLNGLRRALRGAIGSGACVHELAARWGFWHLSSCAADYRRLFGELPSETLRAGARAGRPGR
jgi:AraC family ethanolamine operon transcriptional activator